MLMNRLLAITASPDAVLDMFHSLPQLLSKDGFARSSSSGSIQRDSVLGLFIRRQVLSFNRLSFDGMTRVWERLSMYKDDHIEFLNTPLTPLSGLPGSPLPLSPVLHTERSFDPAPLPTSATEASAFAVVPLDPTHAARSAFMDALALNDYPAAVDALHRYFDYAIHAQLTAVSSPSASTLRPLHVPGLRTPPSLPQNLLPYAILSLAALEVSHGHADEASKALLETVRIAQDTRDPACLVQALMWLQALAPSPPARSKLLRRALARASSLNLPETNLLAALALAQHAATAPERATTLVKSDVSRNLQTFPRAVEAYLQTASQIAANAGLFSLSGAIYATRASVWGMYGLVPLANLATQTQLELHVSDASVPDLAQAHLQLAHTLAFHRGELHLAYESLLRVLPLLQSRSRAALCTWYQSALSLTFESALARGHWTAAREYAYALISLASNVPTHDARNAVVHASLCLARAHLGEGHVAAALDALPPPSSLSGSVLSIRAKLLEGQAHAASQSPVTALQHVLEALTLAETYHANVDKVSVLLALARIQLDLGAPQKARSILDSVASFALSASPLLDRGEYYFVSALTDLASSPPDLDAAVVSLEAAIDVFSDISSYVSLTEAYYLLSRIWAVSQAPGSAARADHAAQGAAYYSDAIRSVQSRPSHTIIQSASDLDGNLLSLRSASRTTFGSPIKLDLQSRATLDDMVVLVDSATDPAAFLKRELLQLSPPSLTHSFINHTTTTSISTSTS